ncbi:helix-turn-helix transcriptional regulator [Dermabacteraceae bacterium P13077]|nr:XRE family transcriptional regulator [Dermabacteraceae bacterium TAE3-ERU5]
MTEHYIGRGEVAKLLGVAPDTLNRYTLPEADVAIGRIRGWRRETIEEWNANRPGKGGRPRTQTQNPQD